MMRKEMNRVDLETMANGIPDSLFDLRIIMGLDGSFNGSWMCPVKWMELDRGPRLFGRIQEHDRSPDLYILPFPASCVVFVIFVSLIGSVCNFSHP